MRTLNAFMQISLDGYFADENNDITWSHRPPDDKEWNDFVAGNASGGGELMFGRITYDMMVSFWPTPEAARQMPVVAERMNNLPKYVISKKVTKPEWKNTLALNGDLIPEIRKLKEQDGEVITILGSGSIVAQLAREGLIDTLQVVVNPVVLGAGKRFFEDVDEMLRFKLMKSRTFNNGNVVLWYAPNS